jgi:hypothetical protein
VYFTKKITPEGLMKVYQALGREAKGENVAVKVNRDEPGGKNFPETMAKVVSAIADHAGMESHNSIHSKQLVKFFRTGRG